MKLRKKQELPRWRKNMLPTEGDGEPWPGIPLNHHRQETRPYTEQMINRWLSN